MSDYEENGFESLPLFRSTDPATSSRAAIDAAESIGRCATLMLCEFQRAAKALTANEAAARCVSQYGGLAETFRKRAGELERKKKIRSTGERICGVTGRSAQVYRGMSC